jgi:hypothetical protein
MNFQSVKKSEKMSVETLSKLQLLLEIVLNAQKWMSKDRRF